MRPQATSVCGLQLRRYDAANAHGSSTRRRLATACQCAAREWCDTDTQPQPQPQPQTQTQTQTQTRTHAHTHTQGSSARRRRQQQQQRQHLQVPIHRYACAHALKDALVDTLSAHAMPPATNPRPLRSHSARTENARSQEANACLS